MESLCTHIFILSNALFSDAPISVILTINLRVSLSSHVQNNIREIKLFIMASKSKYNMKLSYHIMYEHLCK